MRQPIKKTLQPKIKSNFTQRPPIKEKIFRQALWSNDLEDDLVGLQGLAVNPAGQRRVEALRQTLPNCQFLGHNLVFAIVLQYLLTRYRIIDHYTYCHPLRIQDNGDAPGTLLSFPSAEIKSAHSLEYSKFFRALSTAATQFLYFESPRSSNSSAFIVLHNGTKIRFRDHVRASHLESRRRENNAQRLSTIKMRVFK